MIHGILVENICLLRCGWGSFEMIPIKGDKNVLMSLPYTINKALKFAKSFGYDKFRKCSTELEKFRKDSEL